VEGGKLDNKMPFIPFLTYSKIPKPDNNNRSPLIQLNVTNFTGLIILKSKQKGNKSAAKKKGGQKKGGVSFN
jgi:hypothetical protein